MPIHELLALMPPHDGAGADIDWEAVERAWGTSFPGDYKEFMRHYGAGVIEDFLVVFDPSAAVAGQPAGDMADETSVAQEVWEEVDTLPGVDAEPDQILAWATDGTADLLCWVRTGGRPDEWPVLVRARGRDAWELYDCGMVEFLVRVFRAQHPRHPLSGASMWGVSTPRFLTEAEERRIKASGRDPWA